MNQSAVLLTLPARDGQESDAVQGMASPLGESQEDLRLAERVARTPRATGYGPLRDLKVAVRARLAVLGGQVPNYYLKQVAQATALAVPGVERIRNDPGVSRPC